MRNFTEIEPYQPKNKSFINKYKESKKITGIHIGTNGSYIGTGGIDMPISPTIVT